MHEILGLADEADAHRRWFHDDYFDLFVWQTEGGEIVHFQLCYGIDSSEQALVWHKDGGFFLDGAETARSDRGQGQGARKVQAAAFDIDSVQSRFESAAGALPEDIRRALSARIHEFSDKQPSTLARRKRFRRASWQRA